MQNRKNIEHQQTGRSAANHKLSSQAVSQRVEEEELLQNKSITQLVEEEELLQGKFDDTQRQESTVSKNQTGLPDKLKSGIENLSGLDISDVRVHYNSDKPTQMNAHAYAQGSNIHVASGQEQHLPHEAWHTVQQKQGRVEPTTQVNGVAVNDNMGLEREADVMGAKANSF
jgi:predicted transcriptional regulator